MFSSLNFAKSVGGYGGTNTLSIRTSLLVNILRFIQLDSIAQLHIGSPAFKKNYYDSLEVSPKATKSQIKKSYYRLSLLHHPDQNKGNEKAAIKFREITEAYEVLGNISRRRLYDKGLFTLGSASTPEEAEAFSKTVRQTRSGKSGPLSTGRTPIYNFDEWSKNHYETSFARKMEAKRHYEHMVKESRAARTYKNGQAIFLGSFGLLFFFSYLYSISIANEDKPPR